MGVGVLEGWVGGGCWRDGVEGGAGGMGWRGVLEGWGGGGCWRGGVGVGVLEGWGGGGGAGGMGWREERDMLQHQHKQYIYTHITGDLL